MILKKLGKKINKQDFFEKEFQKTLMELTKAHLEELPSIYNMMEIDSIRMDRDALYYKNNNKLLEVIYEIDESNPLLLHIDRVTATWSYMSKLKVSRDNITMTKAQEREIFPKLEAYLKDRNYQFDYNLL